jgi:hypothetical protein
LTQGTSASEPPTPAVAGKSVRGSPVAHAKATCCLRTVADSISLSQAVCSRAMVGATEVIESQRFACLEYALEELIHRDRHGSHFWLGAKGFERKRIIPKFHFLVSVASEVWLSLL